MVGKRLVANAELVGYVELNREQIEASAFYRTQCFDTVFPPTVFKSKRQSATIRWVCNRCAGTRRDNASRYSGLPFAEVCNAAFCFARTAKPGHAAAGSSSRKGKIRLAELSSDISRIRQKSLPS